MRKHSKRHLALLIVIGLANSGEARAQFISQTLGPAGPGNFAILSIGSGSVHLNGPGTTNGNVGIAGGSLSLDGSNGPSIVGNVSTASGVTVSHPNLVQGTISTNQDLSGAVNAAKTASTTFANMSPTLSVPGNAITGTTTITGGPGINVLNVSSINLGNGQSLTLSAPKGAQFIINDSGGLTLNSAQLKLDGGLTASDVVYNVTGKGPDLHTSGGLNNESVINGILLAPDRNIGFAPGLVNGELISGGDIQLVSGASVNMPPGTVPEPASILLVGLGGVGFVALRRWRGRRAVSPI